MGNMKNPAGRGRDTVLDLLLVSAGCMLYGWSMTYLAGIPTIPGNLMGIAAVCNRLYRLPMGAVNLALSVPTLIVGTLVLGKRMLAYTAVTMAGLSLCTDLFALVFPYEGGGNDLALTICSAMIMGCGCGLIMYAGGTTGGTTVLGRLLNRRLPRASLGNLLILMDGMILIGGAVVMRDMASLYYSVMFEVICCKTIDLVMILLRRILPPRW